MRAIVPGLALDVLKFAIGKLPTQRARQVEEPALDPRAVGCGDLQQFDQRGNRAHLGEHQGDQPQQQAVATALDLGLDQQRLVYNLVYRSQPERNMNIQVGSYEAKSKLPELLRGIQAGNRYTITLRGQAVADLVPAEGNKGSDAEAAVDDMLSLMQARKPVGGINLKALINEGRA